MSIISSVLNFFKAIISKVFRFILNFIKKFWWVIALVILCYFGAPFLAAWLFEAGAPVWLVSFVAAIPGYILSAGSALAAAGGAVWSAFAAAGPATQALVVAGIGLALAPDETNQLIGDVASGVGDAVGSVIGGVTTGLLGSNWWIWLVGGFIAYKVITKKKDDDGNADEAPAQPVNQAQSNAPLRLQGT